MAWEGSTRRQRLPKDWPQVRARVLSRDQHRCTHLLPDGSRCTHPATEVDHIVRGDDHSDANLRSLCSPHHKAKTSREGNSASQGARAAARQRRRPPEPHPGLAHTPHP